MPHLSDPLANSSLPTTILHVSLASTHPSNHAWLQVNPSVDRAAREEAALMGRLCGKAGRAQVGLPSVLAIGQEHRRKLFVATFEARRTRRAKLYARLKPKLDPGGAGGAGRAVVQVPGPP